MARAIVIFGATSAIAQAFARLLAAEGDRFFLVARQADNLRAVADDLRVRGAGSVATASADLLELGRHHELCRTAQAQLGGIDIALVAHGVLPDQARCEVDPNETERAIATNFTSAATLLLELAAILEAQQHGSLVVLGSVAGDRGKRSNYVYGAAKAGLQVLQQGLHARLKPLGVHVLLVKLGFVDTPMTASFRKGLLWVTPERAAPAIVDAIARRRSTIYVPWYWRAIMLVIRTLPDRVFLHLKL